MDNIMNISRLERKKKKTISYIENNDMFSVFFNAAKKTLRVSDDQFEYIKTKITEEEKKIVLQGRLTFSDRRKFISIIENHLKNYIEKN